jgi:hypothetical protein
MLYIREELMTILIVVQGLTYIYNGICFFCSYIKKQQFFQTMMSEFSLKKFEWFLENIWRELIKWCQTMLPLSENLNFWEFFQNVVMHNILCYIRGFETESQRLKVKWRKVFAWDWSPSNVYVVLWLVLYCRWNETETFSHNTLHVCWSNATSSCCAACFETLTQNAASFLYTWLPAA